MLNNIFPPLFYFHFSLAGEMIKIGNDRNIVGSIAHQSMAIL